MKNLASYFETAALASQSLTVFGAYSIEVYVDPETLEVIVDYVGDLNTFIGDTVPAGFVRIATLNRPTTADELVALANAAF